MMNFEHVTQWHWVTWILMIIFSVLIVLGIAALFKRSPSIKREPSDESALEILKKRYARGEISEEEYDKVREKITERR